MNILNHPLVEHSVHLFCIYHVGQDYGPRLWRAARRGLRQARGRYIRNGNYQGTPVPCNQGETA